jgi:hypothetical protein
VLTIERVDGKGRSHSGAREFRLADVAESALALRLADGPHLHVLLELHFGRGVLLQLRERLAIGQAGFGEVRKRCQSFCELVMSASKELFLMFVAALVEQDYASLEMRQRDALVPMSLGDHFIGGGLCGFPLVEFEAVLDHFPLAREAVAFVLFVGFLETIQGKINSVLANILEGFFISLLGLFARGAFWLVLREQWCGG